MKEKKVNNETEVLRILSELVNIPSYGKISKEHLILEYLRNSFKDCYETLELEDKNGNTHLLIGVNHELKDIKDSILLSGHMDTVKEIGYNRCLTCPLEREQS